MLRAVIFDMDGTTLYTLEDLSAGLNYALRKNGLPAKPMEEIRTYVGNGVHSEVEHSVPEGTSEEMIEKVYQDFLPWYNQHCNDHTRPYEGIIPLLKKLRENGMKTAIVSNKGDEAVQILDQKYFSGLIDAGVGERADVARKPAPDTVNKVLEALQIDRSEAVYIGDSEVDLATAENAGMACIIVLWGYRDEAFLKEKGARVMVHTVKELEERLLNERSE
jgi:phosphoglycolate phosphatase